MLLKEYSEELQKVIDQNPHVLEMEVVFSADLEGNSFDRIVYLPGSIGYYSLTNREFLSNDEIDEYTDCNGYIKAICIN